MVTHTRNLRSAFNPSKMHTHTAVNTHTPWTPGAVGALLKAPNPSIEGGESAVHSLPPPTIPAGPRFELAEITSPTL